MKKPAQPKKVKIDDITGRVDHYQPGRSLPDLRDGTLQTPPPPKPAPKQAKGWKKLFKQAALFLLILLLAIGGWVGFKAYQNSSRLGTSLWSLFDNSKLKGEDRGRINILLAGDSSDDPGHQGADLTDSIMLISINPNNKTAYMISIPRDLYVNIPGYGYSKINAANVYGKNFNQSGYPDGGMGLLEKTVSERLGVPIDYYALINYTAFKDAVNAVGGVDITIKGQYGAKGVYDPYANLKLANGVQHLNGQTALNLSRARGEGPGSYGVGSDFDRTGYQQQILLALKSKASSAGVLANPVKIGNLFDAAGNNVKTDLSLGNIRRLNNLTKGINDADIKTVSLNSYNGKNYLQSYGTADGQSALVPAAGLTNYTQIRALITELNSSTPTTPPTSN